MAPAVAPAVVPAVALAVAAVVVAVVWWCSTGRVAAAGDAGAATHAAESPGRYSPPVAGPVVDPFRPPPHPYGPGNRGLEYAVAPGSSVAAIGTGVVAHVGPVGGRLVVSLVHPDGLRSSVVGLASTRVVPGQVVARGAVLGTATARVHLGVRRGSRYLDPAALFRSVRPTRSVLVPGPVEGGARERLVHPAPTP